MMKMNFLFCLRSFGVLLSLLFISCPGFATAAENETTDEPRVINSFSDAFTRGKVKGLIRYSGQYRDSDLYLTPDRATPDPDVPTEKKQQYSAIGGYLGYETAPWFNTSIGATLYPLFRTQNQKINCCR